MNTDYYWTRISRISRIVPCGRHFHPSASNCCYCNRKSVKICAICGSINLKRYFLKNIILTDEIVPTDELSSHRLHTQIIFHAEEHGLFRTRINRIERIFHPDHISSKLRQMNTDDFLWGHGDKYSAHGCYFWTRINRIERIFHPEHISSKLRLIS